MRAGSLGWHDELDAAERQRLRRALWISLGIHVGLVVMLVVTPPSFVRDVPQAISVELVAGSMIAPPAAPRPAARPKAAPAPKPKAAPPPAPAPPPPPQAKAPVQVLPENAPKPDKKVEKVSKEKPREIAKAEPKAPAKSESYDDVMKALEDELGDDETTDELLAATARPAPRTAAESSGAAISRSGVAMDPKLAAWQAETLRLIRSKWVTPSDARGRGLVTSLTLTLSASGKLMGEPVIARSSGDPYFDDNAVAALLSIGQLPAPPHAGTTNFDFHSDEE